MHHDDPVFYDGTQEWLKAGEEVNVVSFVRRHGNRAVFVAANLRPEAAEFKPFGMGCSTKVDPKKQPMLAEGFKADASGVVHLDAYGFVVVELAH